MKLMSIAFFALLLSFSAQGFDQSQQTNGGPGALENVFPMSDEKLSLENFAERLSTPGTNDVNASTYTCRAWTNCPGGFRISCWSRGYRCYAEVTPGYRVYCSATSRSGRTDYWVYYCY